MSENKDCGNSCNCTGSGHGHDHNDHSNCCKSTPNPSVVQNLDEMGFERGIWQAAIDNNVDKITHLIKSQKIHPDITDAYGYTALHYAVRNSSLDATKCLIKFGANINCQTRNNKTTPLHRAIMNDKMENLQIIQYLCEHGAKLNLQDTDGKTPLQRAKEKQLKDRNCSKIVELLEKFSSNS